MTAGGTVRHASGGGVVPRRQQTCPSRGRSHKREGRASKKLVPQESLDGVHGTRTYDPLIEGRAERRTRVGKPLLEAHLRVRVEAVGGSTARWRRSSLEPGPWPVHGDVAEAARYSAQYRGASIRQA